MVFTVRRNNSLIRSKRSKETFSVFYLRVVNLFTLEKVLILSFMSYFFTCYDLLLLGHRQLDYRLEDPDPIPGSRIAG